jgi:hypothetical protein
MRFLPILHAPRARTKWNEITHVRLVRGKRPDTPRIVQRWEQLRSMADAHDLVPINQVLASIKPTQRSIETSLRLWSDPRDHGTNSRDKGWLELGYLAP